MALVPKPGGGLRSWAHRTAADAYLQERLRLFVGVSAVALVGLLLLMEGVDLALGEWSLEESVLDPSQLSQLLTAALVTLLYVLLRRRTFAHRALHVMDVVAFLAVTAGGLKVYSESYADELSPLVLTVLCTFMIARAIVVPGTARHALIVSLAVPVGVLAVHLVRGPQPWVTTDPHAGAFAVWHQAVLLLAVAVATIAAHVTFNLRNRVAEAQRMGEYEIDAMIGEGGMGTVYRATHVMLRRPTAIKILNPDIASPRTLERFEREVRLTSRLSHPNNIRIYDYGTTADGLFYYAMEFLGGMDLGEVVRHGGPLPPGRVIHILHCVCSALAEAHGIGLVHRDVKPANLILCRRGGQPDVVKVLDYGIARDLGSADSTLSQESQVAGTPDFMSPEVIQGQGASPRSDIYSLGATAYFAVTGWRVFGARNVGDQLAHHIHTTPIPPRSRLDSVPQDLEAVILRCLRKDPDDRYPDAQSLRAAVDACADAGTWRLADAEAWWQGVEAGPGAAAS